MKIWRMWRRSSLQPKKVEVSQDIKFETWLWNQMKASLNSQVYDSDEDDDDDNKPSGQVDFNEPHLHLESSLTLASDRHTNRSF